MVVVRFQATYIPVVLRASTKIILNLYFNVLENLALGFNDVSRKYNDSKEVWSGSGINIG